MSLEFKACGRCPSRFSCTFDNNIFAFKNDIPSSTAIVLGKINPTDAVVAMVLNRTKLYDISPSSKDVGHNAAMQILHEEMGIKDIKTECICVDYNKITFVQTDHPHTTVSCLLTFRKEFINNELW